MLRRILPVCFTLAALVRIMRRMFWSLAAVVATTGCGQSDVAPKEEGPTDSARPVATSAEPMQLPSVTQPEITFQLRQYPEEQDPRNRGDAILVRLEFDRLRAYDLSTEDVMKALAAGCSFDSPMRIDPPLGVVFVRHLFRVDQHENVILKANAEGEIVRLKDVARLEVIPAEP